MAKVLQKGVSVTRIVFLVFTHAIEIGSGFFWLFILFVYINFTLEKVFV